MTFVAFSNFSLSKKIITEKTSRYSHDILVQTAKNMSSRIDKIEDISFSIFVDREVQSGLQKVNESVLDEYEKSQIKANIESVLASQILYHNEISAVFLTSSDNSIYMLDKTKQGYSVLEEYSEQIFSQKGSTIWFGGFNDNNVVALARSINSIVSQKGLGYMVMYIDAGYLKDVLAEIQYVMGGSFTWLMQAV